MSTAQTARLMSIGEAARAIDESPWTLKRRLLALNERFEGRLLQSFERPGQTVRKWFISPEALLFYVRTDHHATDERIEAIETKLREVELRQVALRNAHRNHRKDVQQQFERQKRWNCGIKKAIEGLLEANGVE